ncbi:HIT family protein [Paenibacillaceae bacterium]|nr:HIT family protein [Paenibacillaceae bacterium]
MVSGRTNAMSGADCIYCLQDERLARLMLPVCSLDAADIYLFRDQLHRGRCVVALNKHYRELHELPEATLRQFMSSVARTAQALQDIFAPDKLNYAIYGDIVDHLHFHLVPKYNEGPDWGQPFQTSSASASLLADEDYRELSETIRRQLLG